MSASSSTATAKLYARKTIQKLSTLNVNASNESIQTISNWIIFNRKKVIDIGDGMLLYITENSSKTAANTSNGNDDGSSEAIGRLMLLVKIINQVLLFNCPTTVDGDNTTMNDTDDTTDKWIKSSQLRIKLSEIVILPLWKALATSLHTSNTTVKDQYSIEIKNIVDNWKKCNVFDSVTILDEYKRGWSRALKDASTSVGDASKNNDGVKEEEEEQVEDEKPTASTDKNEADEKAVASSVKEEESSNSKVEQAALTSEGTNEDTNEDTNSKKNEEKEDVDMTDEKVEDKADDQNVPVEEMNSTMEGSGKKEVDQQVSSSARRDSIADVEVDFEVRYNIMCALYFNV